MLLATVLGVPGRRLITEPGGPNAPVDELDTRQVATRPDLRPVEFVDGRPVPAGLELSLGDRIRTRPKPLAAFVAAVALAGTGWALLPKPGAGDEHPSGSYRPARCCSRWSPRCAWCGRPRAPASGPSGGHYPARTAPNALRGAAT